MHTNLGVEWKKGKLINLLEKMNQTFQYKNTFIGSSVLGMEDIGRIGGGTSTSGSSSGASAPLSLRPRDLALEGQRGSCSPPPLTRFPISTEF